MEVSLKQAEAALLSLGFTCQPTEYSIDVVVPWWRNDVNIEDDLVEEVVRVIGYDSVPTVMLSTPIPFHSRTQAIALRDEIKDLLAAGGMQEVINYPLASTELLERVGPENCDVAAMRIANPMSSTHEYLRPTLQAGLLATLAANYSTGPGPFRFFEAGRVFLPRSDNLPEEVETVAGVLSGRRNGASWLAETSSNGGMDFYDAKGIVEWLLGRLGISATWEPGEHTVYQPGRSAVVKSDGATLGYVGEIHPSIRERFDLDSGTVAGFELSLPALLDAQPDSERRFESLPRFPAATRDLALVVPADVPAGRVTELIMRNRLVQRAELFDIYSGDNLAPGTKSLAFHVHLQAADRTLTNEEVARSMDGMLRNLEREVGASLRG
jgi:phenylalanyl-tRNA synthetase beta chain